jgi:hypothetical protein
MRAPSVAELLGDPSVREALEQAWKDSLADDPARRHEEGGWIYMDITSANVAVGGCGAGAKATLDLSAPSEIPGAVVVATFHTHPNPSAEGWEPGPSRADTQSAWLFGVPCIIRADDGIHTTGPDSRRGGPIGGPRVPDSIGARSRRLARGLRTEGPETQGRRPPLHHRRAHRSRYLKAL